MDEKTKKIIKERFDALPKTIQDVILSSNYENSLIEIGKKFQLTVEQLGMLEQETTLVMMGLSPVKNFETELTNELKIDETKCAQIVTEINEKVFLTIRDLLKLMYTPAGEEPSVYEEIPQNNQTVTGFNFIKKIPSNVEKPIESREELLRKIENPEPIKPITNYELRIKEQETKSITNKEENNLITNLNKNNTQPILEQKLSGTFQTSTTETNHSLDNLSKIDPYREPTE